MQIKGSSKFDPCLTPPEEVGNQLKLKVVGDGSELDEALRKGEFDKAISLALSVLQVVNAKPACGKGLNVLLVMLVCTNLNYSLIRTVYSKNFGRL